MIMLANYFTNLQTKLGVDCTTFNKIDWCT